MTSVDPSFTALPLQALADVALQRAVDLGVEHAEFRLQRVHGQHLAVRDGALEGSSDAEDLGFAVRVVMDGAWGFAADVVLTPEAAVYAAESAVRVARVAAAMTSTPVVLAPEPVYADATWVSAYDVDPLDVPVAEKSALLVDWTARLRAHAGVQHATAHLEQVVEHTFYADLAGTRTTQKRVRIAPSFDAMGADEGRGLFDSMRSLAPPAGRGWEYALGTGWDWDTELAEVPDLLAQKLAAPSVEAGRYDLVVDPSNLWLTIHESIGHATELDRVLGYEANYAGTSFATYDGLGTLRYGSPAMTVTGDRVEPHGLATIGYDAEGVETQRWDIVREGILVGYQLDRAMAHLKPELNGDRSNGCSFADSSGHVPMQRMANVSLAADPDGPSTEELIARVERGVYVVGDRSWSIDMQRFNFQFTGQRFFRIEDGRLAGQLRDVAYQATTTEFWGSLEAVGGPQTWVLGGATNCGKAQPGQSASVSHGCPTGLFRDVNILDTRDEAGH